MVEILSEDVPDILSHRVGVPLVPRAVPYRLLGGEDMDKSVGELIEPVALLNMTVKRHGVELRQDIDVANLGIDTVADREIDEAVLTGDRNGRFCPVPRQGKETAAPSSTEHDGNDIFRRNLTGHAFTLSV